MKKRIISIFFVASLFAPNISAMGEVQEAEQLTRRQHRDQEESARLGQMKKESSQPSGGLALNPYHTVVYHRQKPISVESGIQGHSEFFEQGRPRAGAISVQGSPKIIKVGGRPLGSPSTENLVPPNPPGFRRSTARWGGGELSRESEMGKAISNVAGENVEQRGLASATKR